MSSLDIILLALAIVLGAVGVYGGYIFGQQRSQLRYQEAQLRHEEQMRQAAESAESRLVQLQEEQRRSLQEARDESEIGRASCRERV